MVKFYHNDEFGPSWGWKYLLLFWNTGSNLTILCVCTKLQHIPNVWCVCILRRQNWQVYFWVRIQLRLFTYFQPFLYFLLLEITETFLLISFFFRFSIFFLIFFFWSSMRQIMIYFTLCHGSNFNVIKYFESLLLAYHCLQIDFHRIQTCTQKIRCHGKLFFCFYYEWITFPL